jgi:putative aminopeptidase FrvX
MVSDRLSERNEGYLEKFALMPSAPGFEDEVQGGLIGIYGELGAMPSNELNFKDPMPVFCHDALGNLYLKLPGEEELPKVAILAHADSPAFLIESVSDDRLRSLLLRSEDSTFLSARPIGWKGCIDRKLWAGSPLVIKTNEGYASASFITKSVHLQESGEEDYTADESEIRVDVGTRFNSELKRLGIGKGTPAFFEPRFRKLIDPEIVCGTNLDDRVGTVALIELANRFLGIEERGDIYLVSTVSEEADPQGSKLVAKMLHPLIDLAVSIDSTVAIDTFHGDVDATHAAYGYCNYLDAGFTLRKNGFNRLVTNHFQETAEKERIKFQIEAERESVSTDEIYMKMEGIPTAAIMIPTRNLHSMVETVCTRDLQRAIEVIYNAVLGLSKNTELEAYLNEILRQPRRY